MATQDPGTPDGGTPIDRLTREEAIMKRLATVVCLVCVVFVVGRFLAPASAPAQPPDFGVVVGKWTWAQAATCAACPAFRAVLTITSVSPDGAMSGTYLHPLQTQTAVPVSPRATMVDGKIKVALKVGPLSYDLEYTKRDDSLAGPVAGYPARALIREATFQRDK